MPNQPHTITIEIAPDGQITGQVTGVKGPTCTSLSAWLNALGQVVEDRHTPDFHKQQGVNAQVGGQQ